MHFDQEHMAQYFADLQTTQLNQASRIKQSNGFAPFMSHLLMRKSINSTANPSASIGSLSPGSGSTAPISSSASSSAPNSLIPPAPAYLTQLFGRTNPSFPFPHLATNAKLSPSSLMLPTTSISSNSFGSSLSGMQALPLLFQFARPSKVTVFASLLDTATKRTYSCGLCNKTFGHEVGLTQHQSIHNNEKCFRCKQCGKTFKR